MKYIEWFGGIGAFTQATKNSQKEWKLIDYVELDKHAVNSFNAMNDTNFTPKDINNVDVSHYPEVDLLIAGWPCQSLSRAGNRKGMGINLELDKKILENYINNWIIEYMNKGKISKKQINIFKNEHPEIIETIKNDFINKIEKLNNFEITKDNVLEFALQVPITTTSSLIFKTIQKINEMKFKPKHILLENVKGLLNKNNLKGKEIIEWAFEKLGYKWNEVLLNSKYFNVSQARERVYMLLTRNDVKEKKLDHLLNFKTVNKVLKDILDFSVPTKTFNLNKILINDYGKIKFNYTNYVYLPPKNKEKPLTDLSGRRLWKIDKNCGTVITKYPLKIWLWTSKNILYYRNITALETWRLMGFSDETFNKAKEVVSNSQLYKQAGNSIVVNVLQEIIKVVENE